jgi:N-carbamoyl-L-amino-acid hydrolase
MEVVAFTAEEPTPFGISTVGSRAMAGILSGEDLERTEDEGSRTLAEAIAFIGGDPARIRHARRTAADVLAYLELHIEQGPVLFSEKTPIGIVYGIVGIHRARIDIRGRNDHAGTTPMGARKDALAASSEIVLAVEEICGKNPKITGTVGQIAVKPNSVNVVPGTARLGLDLRSIDDEGAAEFIEAFEAALDNIRQKRELAVDWEIMKVADPTRFDIETTRCLKNACRETKSDYREMVSWAGHDAMHMSTFALAGMIFIPSRDGRSHCPEEFSKIEDIATGCRVLAATVHMIDSEGNL